MARCCCSSLAARGFRTDVATGIEINRTRYSTGQVEHSICDQRLFSTSPQRPIRSLQSVCPDVSAEIMQHDPPGGYPWSSLFFAARIHDPLEWESVVTRQSKGGPASSAPSVHLCPDGPWPVAPHRSQLECVSR